MPHGTLCISKVDSPETYCATFVPYDGTQPCTVTMRGPDKLLAFLESAGLPASQRASTLEEVAAVGVALLMNADVTVGTIAKRAA